MTKEINLNHITKIEGHANLTLKIENNKVIKCELKAMEGARFFEGLILNKNLEDIQEIVSRICGICSAAHSVCAIQALEEAIKIKPSKQQKIIRELLMIGERIRSHSTHLYFLSLPDYFDKESALDLGSEHKDKINNALSLITLGNRIVETFGGREMHPFLKIKEKLPELNTEKILHELSISKPKIIETIKLFEDLDYPKLERETDYLCLHEPDDYPAISGKIISNTGLFIDDDYDKHLKENIKEYATSKFVLKEGKAYMLGSIARINNNYMALDHESQHHLKEFLIKKNLKFPLKNPHYNNFCQAIELLIMQKRAIKIIQDLPKNLDKVPDLKIKIKEGIGVSAVEAPRGTLFHEYKVDKTGKIIFCNIITPTAQNLNMIEADIIMLVNKLLANNETKEKITKELEKLIRSYDPCFSCSTHFLKVNWI
jgi:sulfhydrogenase subunit alpha